MDNTAQNWYIVQENTGICQIIALENGKTPVNGQYWGPFAERGEAIASRVGLIRAGKCQPIV
ncbi:hypothetical protein B1L04_14185 [Microcystis aeruginosa KW]|uniref:DDE transposase family protein n=1 Tax=Microcystis aeruginosa KW TaxID=1960155 RepID=A0A1V4BRT1_MICAE|nr:hypothetical protein [Microcystis aeruginosa]OPF17203.1 hypothetical protein B1L04_14185 [Microcystis aeruginosa KW]